MSGHRLAEAISLLAAARQRLLDDPELAGDQDLLADYLASDPESCSEWETLERLARAIINLEEQAKMAAARAKEIAARGDRFENRASALRDTLKQALITLDQKRLRAPDFTASIGPGRSHVIITDATELDDMYVRITRTPMLREIGEALDAGETVRGATRSNPSPTLTIRKS